MLKRKSFRVHYNPHGLRPTDVTYAGLTVGTSGPTFIEVYTLTTSNPSYPGWATSVNPPCDCPFSEFDVKFHENMCLDTIGNEHCGPCYRQLVKCPGKTVSLECCYKNGELCHNGRDWTSPATGRNPDGTCKYWSYNSAAVHIINEEIPYKARVAKGKLQYAVGSRTIEGIVGGWFLNLLGADNPSPEEVDNAGPP